MRIHPALKSTIPQVEAFGFVFHSVGEVPVSEEIATHVTLAKTVELAGPSSVKTSIVQLARLRLDYPRTVIAEISASVPQFAVISSLEFPLTPERFGETLRSIEEATIAAFAEFSGHLDRRYCVKTLQEIADRLPANDVTGAKALAEAAIQNLSNLPRSANESPAA